MQKSQARARLSAKIRAAPIILTAASQRVYSFGFHKSANKGQGFDFLQHSQYQEGDDQRFIDWAVYGRTKQKFVKRFREEQDMPILLVVDIGEGMFAGIDLFFDFCATKAEAAFAVAAAFQQSAKELMDPIGYFFNAPGAGQSFFTPKKAAAAEEGLEALWDVVWKRVSQRKPRTHLDDTRALRQIAKNLTHGGKSHESQDYSGSFIAALGRLSKQDMLSSHCVIISDFGESFLPAGMDEYKRAIKRLKNRHSLQAVCVRTCWEYGAPDVKTEVSFRGARRQLFRLNLGSGAVQNIYGGITEENQTALKRFFSSAEIPAAFVETKDNLFTSLERQFMQ